MKRKEILVTKRIGGNKKLIMNWGRGKKEMDLLGQHKLSHAQLTPKVCNPAELS